MSGITRTRAHWWAVPGAVAVGAVATYVAVAAQPPRPDPPLRPEAGLTTRSIRQPIGTPRISLDPGRISKTPPRIPRLPGVCAAPVDVNITVNPANPSGAAASPGRGFSMKMRTEQKAVWYSLVDSIPPIGHTASVTVDPVRLLEGDRKVGTLLSGEVKFREVVRDIPLNGTEAENHAKVQALLKNFGQLTEAKLNALAPIKMPEYVIPSPGIQVMRARLEETYEIDGIGKDTVQLSGWIAVRHGAGRPMKGATEVTWETAVVDTEFVGMDLKGQSDLFGEVLVTLDTTRPSLGQVGRIEIPDLARFALIAKLKKEMIASNVSAAPMASQRQE